MSDADASWITDEANHLNRTLNEAAARHGWTSVAVTDTFRRHGYCASDRWFRTWEESLATQEDVSGTAHPNGTGHQAVAELVTPRVTLDALAPPLQRLEVRFLRARVIDDDIGDPNEPGPLDPHVDFSVLWQRSVCGHAIETRRGFGIATNGATSLTTRACDSRSRRSAAASRPGSTRPPGSPERAARPPAQRGLGRRPAAGPGRRPAAARGPDPGRARGRVPRHDAARERIASRHQLRREGAHRGQNVGCW